MTRRAAWGISAFFLLIAVGLLILLWLYVASVNLEIKKLTADLIVKKDNVEALNDNISELNAEKRHLIDETLKLSNRLSLISKTSVELKNTLKGDRDYFSILGDKYVDFCAENSMENCEYFDLHSRLLIARLDAATLRLSADNQEDYRVLDSTYMQINLLNDCLFAKFADSEAIERAPVTHGAAKCVLPQKDGPVGVALNQINNLILNQTSDPTGRVIPRSALLSWSVYDHLSFRVFGLEGRAFANWKMGNLSEARQFITKAQKIGNGFTSVRLTLAKLDCASGNSPDQARLEINALKMALNARISNANLAADERRNAQIGLDQVIHDAELYDTCRLPNGAI